MIQKPIPERSCRLLRLAPPKERPDTVRRILSFLRAFLMPWGRRDRHP